MLDTDIANADHKIPALVINLLLAIEWKKSKTEEELGKSIG